MDQNLCPHCQNKTKIIKKGSYIRTSDNKKIQRFECQSCLKTFSEQIFNFDYRLRKRRINQVVFRSFAKGSSQRAIAEMLQVDPKTIARRIKIYGRYCRQHLEALYQKKDPVEHITFDEMETFEHTKLKPVTIALAVESDTRLILGLSVGQIAANGHLAEMSREKYGHRECERKKVLNELFENLKKVASLQCCFSSDKSQHYSTPLNKYFPESVHKAYKGRKAAIVGQGEMKKGGFDPLFCLNHTAAMIRDNLKRMARRTWCTTKRIDRLIDSLYIYASYHNQRILGVRRPVISSWATPS